MQRSKTRDRATLWRAPALLALTWAVLGCCCPALPPPALAWQLEPAPPAAPRSAQIAPARAH